MDTTNMTRRACKARYESLIELACELARVGGALPMSRTVIPNIDEAAIVSRAMLTRIQFPDDDSPLATTIRDRYAAHVREAHNLGMIYPTLPKEERGGHGGGRKPLSEDEKAARLFSDA